MAHSDAPPPGPDLAQGIPSANVPTTGVLAGHVDGEVVLLLRRDGGLFAVGGTCTHFGGPLAEGLVAGDEVRCPWHHACFDLRTGAALKTPAFASLPTWRVEQVGDTVFVRERIKAQVPPAVAKPAQPERIVIIGGGAAGFAAADRLRRLGYAGTLTMLSADDAPPCDRPNLSKDYLAGTAPEDWIPLKGPEFYDKHRIDLRTGCEVVSIDTTGRRIATRNGETHPYDVLLIATGAEPKRLPTPASTCRMCSPCAPSPTHARSSPLRPPRRPPC